MIGAVSWPRVAFATRIHRGAYRMAQLLIVHGDPVLLQAMREYLEGQGHEVLTASCGVAALDHARASSPDLVVLDAALRGMDGMEVLRRLRRASDVPVILVGATAEESNVLRAFALGADDYVARPCRLPELAARVGAVLARVGRGHGCASILARGGLVVDLGKHRVRRRDDWIKLTPTEFRLLVLLMEEPGRVMSAEELVTRVWGAEYAGQADYVRRYIWYLRHKLEDDPDRPAFLQNERNVGYFFSEQRCGVDGAAGGG